MLTRQDLGAETERRIARAVARWKAAEAEAEAAAASEADSNGHPDAGADSDSDPAFKLDHDSAVTLRHLLEQDGRSGTTRRVRFAGRPAFVYLGFARGGEPFVHGIGESPELAIAEAFLNSDARSRHP